MTGVVVLKRKPAGVQEVRTVQPVQTAAAVNGAPMVEVAEFVLHLKRRVRVPIHPVANLLQVITVNAVR